MENIAELLKDCPNGMELDCTNYDGIVKFDGFNKNNPYTIRISVMYDGVVTIHTLTKYGQTSVSPYNKCVIFPKGKTTWVGFQRPFKDGDIVAFDNPHRDNLQVFIFRNKKENSTLSSCYLMLDDDELYLEEGMWYITRHATEEEKEKLFQVIKNNGYKWNAETKTLEKLIEPKFKVGDRIVHKNEGNPFTITEITDGCYKGGTRYAILITQQDNFELVPNKFDINSLKPFDKVLVRDNNEQKWTVDYFSFVDKEQVYPFVCAGHYTNQCIPYEGNEHLLGTADDCDEYFKNWE